MNRNKLKTYAPQARRDFIKAVTDRAAYYGLTKTKIEPVIEQGDVAIIAGKPFPRAVAEKRKRLEDRIRGQGFEQVMEAIAYTWFNRFVAIRYMELHGYLDHGYRVLSHPEGNTSPEIVEHAEHVDLTGLEREKVIELKLEGTKEAELYRMLLVAQCNALNRAMPFLFEWVDDETELLLPENLLHSDSLIRKLVNEIPEEDWGQIEIIGWLYQFYISEKKDQVIGKVVKSEDIPAATQLFTPNWIVKYMVQNTIGRQWLATYPNSPLRSQMEFYIEPAEQTPEVEDQLRAITPESLNPEEITLLDDACGSGHILVEAYDIFKAIYQERGYRSKDIPRLILEKNLFGLEIDDRAAQLAAFALMMKARSDDRRIFDSGVKLNILAIQESKGLDAKKITETLNVPRKAGESVAKTSDISQADIAQLIDLFEHGKTFGSLIRVPEALAKKLLGIMERIEDMLAHGDMYGKAAAEAMMPIIKQAQLLAGKYHAVVTNPPYMGNKGMNTRLKAWLGEVYPISKSDLMTCFMERAATLTVKGGFWAMINLPSWMFLSSYAQLRHSMVLDQYICSLLHLGRGIFGPDFGTVAFVIQKAYLPSGKAGVYRRLFEKHVQVRRPEEIKRLFLIDSYGRFDTCQNGFLNIPGTPIAYWVPEKFARTFKENESFSDYFIAKQGLATGDNDRFIRFWSEVNLADIDFRQTAYERFDSDNRWFPYSKGGQARKWYGNNELVIDWKDNGKSLKEYKDVSGKRLSTLKNLSFMFAEAFTWSLTSIAGILYVRWRPNGFVFDTNGMSAFPKHESMTTEFGVSLLNSKVSQEALKLLNPTMAFQSGDIDRVPMPKNMETLKKRFTAGACIELARLDWDSFETSWGFTSLPLQYPSYRQATLKSTYTDVRVHWRKMTFEMQRLEEENNRMFIEAYGLQDELTPEVPVNEITLTCNPHYRYGGDRSDEELEAMLLADTMKELISYAIGCMMGRYSQDKPGVIYAYSGNQGFDPSQYKIFPADQDGIIPVNENDWFDEDVANRFVEFIGVAWPKESLEENLKFIAESLGNNRGESTRETIRRYLATGFFKHHLSMYKKRPIYWLFSSGKQRAFQCLVYLHRYNEATLSRMRTEYVIPLQGKISARIDQLAGDIAAAASTSHRKKLEKERDKLVKQQAELHAFDEKLRHYADQRISLDLDDGVKVNYGKFGDLLAEVSAVTGAGAD